MIKALEVVMAEHPMLNFAGYGRPRMSPNFNLGSQRQSLMESASRVGVAMEYLASLPVVKVTSRRARDSYELKHKAERTDRAMAEVHGYISNGALIAAAYMLGLEVKPTGLNATIGVGWGPGER